MKVRGYGPTTTGDYTLRVRFEASAPPPSDQGGTRATAAVVSAPSDTAAALTEGDVDYFRIDVASAGLLDVHTGGFTDTRGRLEGSGGALLEADGDGGEDGNFRIARYVAAGTYYVKVTGDDGTTAGSYTLRVRLDTDAPPPSDQGGTRATAAVVSPGSDTDAGLAEGDVDYFRITVESAGNLEVYTSGTADTLRTTETHGRLEDSEGRELVSNDDRTVRDRNSRIVRAVTAGTYYVKVTGVRPTTAGDYRFHVRFDADAPPPPPSDQGGTRATAAVVFPVSDTDAGLTAGDVDYFRITVASSGLLEVHTGGATDTQGRLEGSAGAWLADDGDGGEGGNFRIERTVSTGTYYVRVTGHDGAVGSYTLRARFTAAGARGTAAAVLPVSDTDAVLTAGDVDYFRIDVPSAGGLEVYTSGATDTVGRLERSDGARLAAAGDGGAGGNFRIGRRTVPAGIYYVRVTGDDAATAGSYTLHVRFGGNPDQGGTRGTAVAVTPRSNTLGDLTAGDVDYFLIELASSGSLAVHTSGATDTVGRLEDSGGARLAAAGDGGAGGNFRIERNVPAGIYYVRVTGRDGASGSYTLRVRFEGNPDQGGARGTAADVSVPSETLGDLTAGDVDYFRITVESAGRLEVHTSGATDTVGRLEGSGGSRLADDGDGGEGLNFRIGRDVQAGTYYVRVAGHDGATAGSYTLHVDFGSSAPPPDQGGARLSAAGVSPRSDTSASLTAGDRDYFRIRVESAGRLEVHSSGATDTVGRLEDSDGSRLVTDNDGGAGRNFRIVRHVPAGTYFLMVRGRGSSTGSYTLHVRFRADPTEVSVPSDTAASLTAGETDRFRIRVASSGYLEVHTSGGTATSGHLEDSGGQELANDGRGGAGRNFRIVRHVPAGTYYIGVTGDDAAVTGGYTLHVRHRASLPDHGDTLATAAAVSVPSDTFGFLTAGDVDHFRITVRAAGRLEVYTTGQVNAGFGLRNSGGTALDEIFEGEVEGILRMRWDVSAGTYYVRLAGDTNTDTGPYTLRARFVASSPPPPPSGDDQGSTRGTAETVSLPSETDAGLTAGDVDYFRIDVPSSGRLTVHSSGGTDTVGRLEDSGGSRLATDNDGGAGRNFRVARDVTAGTYYLMVRGRRSSTGSYTLHARFDGSPSSALGAPLASLARRTMNEVSTVIGRRTSGDGGTGFAAFAGLAGNPGGCAAFGTPAECAGRSLGQAGVRPGSVGTDGRPASLTLADLRGLVRNQGFSVSLGRPAAEGPGARFAPGGAAAGDGPRLTLWGGGGGSAPGGALFLGMDAAVDGRWTAGLAFAESEGTAALSGGDASARGFAETRLSAVYPYARASLGGGLTLWGIAGSGRGTVDGLWSGEAPSPGPADLPEAGRAPPEGSVRLGGGLAFGMGLVGAERTLHRGGGLDVSAAGDAGWARLSVESGAAAGASASVTRARMGLRMRYASPDGGWTGGLRLGARADGGDGETGSGLEASGEAARGWGRWRAGAEGRWYSAGVSGSRGVSATLAMARRGDGTGLGFSLSQGWGAETAGLSGKAGAAGLLPAPAETAKAADGRPAAWIGGRAAWGAKLPGPGRRLLAPHAALRLERGGGRHLRAGIDLGAFGGAAGLGLAFETRRTGAAEADVHAVTLRLSAGF